MELTHINTRDGIEMHRTGCRDITKHAMLHPADEIVEMGDFDSKDEAWEEYNADFIDEGPEACGDLTWMGCTSKLRKTKKLQAEPVRAEVKSFDETEGFMSFHEELQKYEDAVDLWRETYDIQPKEAVTAELDRERLPMSAVRRMLFNRKITLRENFVRWQQVDEMLVDLWANNFHDTVDFSTREERLQKQLKRSADKCLWHAAYISVLQERIDGVR